MKCITNNLLFAVISAFSRTDSPVVSEGPNGAKVFFSDGPRHRWTSKPAVRPHGVAARATKATAPRPPGSRPRLLHSLAIIPVKGGAVLVDAFLTKKGPKKQCIFLAQNVSRLHGLCQVSTTFQGVCSDRLMSLKSSTQHTNDAITPSMFLLLFMPFGWYMPTNLSQRYMMPPALHA